MKYFILVFLLASFSYAHKVNLFISSEKDKVEIYSYFANGAACKNCKLIIENKKQIVLEDVLNNEGKYTYISPYKELEIIIDASSGHLAKESISVKNIKKENLKSHLKSQKDEKYLNIFIGLLLIALIFFLLKRFKK
ncbi:MAG: hypothetical protein ACNI28_12350 [Arcobacter sp.]|uniref:hypothetical protein n=1 Tax=Arcobacter sp. TaxID=1872629 RepID=UPI003B006419